MYIHFHEPWKDRMNMKYQDILRTFSKTCEKHKQIEIELKKQIDEFISEFRKSLDMLYPHYFAANDTMILFHGATNEEWIRKPKITATPGYVQPHNISGADIDTKPVLCIPFTLHTVIGGDMQGAPYTSLDTPIKMGKEGDLIIVLVGEKRFSLPETANLPQFDEVFSYIKMQLNERCKG